MIRRVTAVVWECTACGWKWFPKAGDGRTPKRCPSRKCRKLASYAGEVENVSDDGLHERGIGFHTSEESEEVVGRPKELAREQEGLHSTGDSSTADERVAAKTSATKKLTLEEFWKLKPSEQMRAKREGKY